MPKRSTERLSRKVCALYVTQLSKKPKNQQPKLTTTLCLSTGREAERARERYDKATAKLHNLHNQYVLAVCGARTQQDEHRRRAAPALLDALQRMQEDMTLALWVTWLRPSENFNTLSNFSDTSPVVSLACEQMTDADPHWPRHSAWRLPSVEAFWCVIAVKVSWKSTARSAVCWRRRSLKSIRRFQQRWSRSILWWSTNISSMPTGQKVNSGWHSRSCQSCLLSWVCTDPLTGLRKLLRQVWSLNHRCWRKRKTFQPMRSCGTRWRPTACRPCEHPAKSPPHTHLWTEKSYFQRFLGLFYEQF